MSSMNPIADALSAIKNASDTGKPECTVEPASRLMGAILRIMQEHGYISGFEVMEDGRGGQFLIHLSGTINKCGAITPRYSTTLGEMEFWEGQYLPAKNFGILLLSTSTGVMAHEEARKMGIGGQLLGYVY